MTSFPGCPLTMPTRRPARSRGGAAWSATDSLAATAVVLAVVLGAAGAEARFVPCRHEADAGKIADALGRIRRSVDPCGESPQVVTILDELERCTRASYEICTDATATRNLFEGAGDDGLGTITWNPELRSELEGGCGEEPATRVMRDPVASLLHEIVHAADDCMGREPGQHELEAVRVENIYRRAAGLRSRTGYGDARLAATPAEACAPDRCECLASPTAQTGAQRETHGQQAADSDGKPGEVAADPAR